MNEKKLSVFIADDEPHVTAALRGMIDTWSINRNVSPQYIITDRLTDTFCERAAECDLVLLDIEMNGTNGLDFARGIREKSDRPTIAIITSHTEFALEGYDAQVVAYLIKPVSQAKLDSVLELSLKKTGDMSTRRMVFKRNKSLYYIPVSDIICIEAQRHSSLVTTEKETLSFPVSVGELSESIPSPPIIRCHRGFFVNVNHIKCYESAKSLRMDNGDSVPIGKVYLQDVKRVLFEELSK